MNESIGSQSSSPRSKTIGSSDDEDANLGLQQSIELQNGTKAAGAEAISDSEDSCLDE